jgi:hypothetical protein
MQNTPFPFALGRSSGRPVFRADGSGHQGLIYQEDGENGRQGRPRPASAPKLNL